MKRNLTAVRLGLNAALGLVMASLTACHEPSQGSASQAQPPATPAPNAASQTAALQPVAMQAAAIKQLLLPAHGCNIETADGAGYNTTLTRSRGATIELRGWVIDTMQHDVPVKAVLRLENQDQQAAWMVPLQPRLVRTDVAQANGGLAAYTPSGFEISVATSVLPAGHYHLYIEYAAAGRSYACDNGRMLDLTH
ncbi:MAG: hypothetical protein G3I10_00045 [Ferrovum sp.]|nr:hypothetical protein [Ferrovum sp.]